MIERPEAYFGVFNNRGFHLRANGITISVQFGPGHYCERYANNFDEPKESYEWLSRDAEVAMWDSKGEWITEQVFGRVLKKRLSDTVAPNVTPQEVVKLISWMHRRKK